MIIYKKVIDISVFIESTRRINDSIGFVPTMGALHQGHLSLIEESKKDCNLTVCSIFVNPTQFNDKSDFEKYPVTLEADIALLESVGCDVLFIPTVREIYPDNNIDYYDLGLLEEILEGKYRSGHFQGVCQIVSRLLDVVRPSIVFVGQKDYQQCMVIKKLIQIKGIDASVVICPTKREFTGLAMSSRNVRLSVDGKVAATAIYKSLLFVKESISYLPLNDVKEQVETALFKNGFSQIDYVELCDATSLKPITYWDSTTPIVVLIAATIEGVRLIDNLVIS